MLTRRKAGVFVSLVALIGVLVTGMLVSRRIVERPRTDDAYLQAYVVHLAPDVSGRIVELNVRDNEMVQRGQILFQIDPEPYRLRVDQARSQVRELEAKVAVTGMPAAWRLQ
jgi:multidrug efflux system membrane fusion protein